MENMTGGGGHTERIDGMDTLKTSIMKLAEGNPGALRVCCELIKASPIVDPGFVALTDFAPLLTLDSIGIYGSHIWLLYKDICGEDIINTLAVLRASQLGIISRSDVLTAVTLAEDPCGDPHSLFDPAEVLEKVRARLPGFAETPLQAPSDGNSTC